MAPVLSSWHPVGEYGIKQSYINTIITGSDFSYQTVYDLSAACASFVTVHKRL